MPVNAFVLHAEQPDDQLYETVLLAPQTTPFVGSDQAALHALLATFEPAWTMWLRTRPRRWLFQCHLSFEKKRSDSEIYGAKFDRLQMIKKPALCCQAEWAAAVLMVSEVT
jgi:hypothetical protein